MIIFLADRIPIARFSVQSDIYAYGMFLYEVLTHHFPFENFVETSPIDGSPLSFSKQHWSLHDIHRHANDRLASRLHKAAQANLCIPKAIQHESPDGFSELLKHCIEVRF
jgi:serine/threonine protein kinase